METEKKSERPRMTAERCASILNIALTQAVNDREKCKAYEHGGIEFCNKCPDYADCELWAVIKPMHNALMDIARYMQIQNGKAQRNSNKQPKGNNENE